MRWYDQKTDRCEACGWFGNGTWPTGELAGQEYEACRYHGYIFHRTTDESCKEFKTPRMVQEYLEKMKKKKTQSH